MVKPQSSKLSDPCPSRGEGALNMNSMTEIEIKIIELRKEGYTYTGIQLRLGMPSKKYIKNTLKEYCPELLGDVVENPGRLQKNQYRGKKEHDK